ncbi:MAG: Heavy-metal-associated domain [Pyrinomonadaceae bacterium]|jgi:copper chaperone CopZ|nr:Heavy-metal-associated domain [Pyrinomonadaceae bacterium]
MTIRTKRAGGVGRSLFDACGDAAALSLLTGGSFSMRESEFHIKGMHCESCAVDIKETLETTAGVFRTEVTYGGKTANVAYDDAIVQETTLIKKIQDLGYSATTGDESQATEATA